MLELEALQKPEALTGPIDHRKPKEQAATRARNSGEALTLRAQGLGVIHQVSVGRRFGLLSGLSRRFWGADVRPNLGAL